MIGVVCILIRVSPICLYVMAYNMGGFSWEKAGQIWYAALTKELTPSSDFAAAKTATIKTGRHYIWKSKS